MIGPAVRWNGIGRGVARRYIGAMRRRLLLLDLDPGPPPWRTGASHAVPLVMLPLPGGRAAAALPLRDETPEEALAALLADGVAIRGSRVIEL